MSVDQRVMETKAQSEKLLYHAADGKASEMQALRGYSIDEFFMYLKNKK
jgi:hypothetical protein